MKYKQNISQLPLQCIHVVVTWREHWKQRVRCAQVQCQVERTVRRRMCRVCAWALVVRHPAVLGDTQEHWHSLLLHQIQNRSWDKLQSCHQEHRQLSPVKETLYLHTSVNSLSLLDTQIRFLFVTCIETTSHKRYTSSPPSPQPTMNNGRSSGESPDLF